MIDRNTLWREIPPVDFDTWRVRIVNAGGPAELASEECWDAAGKHSAVLLNKLRAESSYGARKGRNDPAQTRNPFSLRRYIARPGQPGIVDSANEGNPSGYLHFDSWPEGVEACRLRITDPTAFAQQTHGASNPYPATVTLSDLVYAFSPPGPGGIWNDTERIVRESVAAINGYELSPVVTIPPGEEPTPMETITFGRVPMYGYSDRQHVTKDKPEGVGWNNLGKRNPKFIALHRMWGSLQGTDGFFGDPTVQALTDVGIGVEAMDGEALAGHIYLWNDPLGYRSGWASGRVSAPYGDGKKIVDKYGLDAVNRDGFSVEISGKELTPIDDVAWQELVHLCAWWVDFMKIPYNTRVNPATGINYLIWHEEFTLGTGKKCPFDVVKALTNRLYNDIASYLKPFQTGAAGEPVPDPIPVPEPEPIPDPQYAPPVPIAALAEFSDFEADSMRAVVTAEGHDFIFVNDIVKAIRPTPRLQRAFETALDIGPVIEAGAEFEATWLFEAQDGREYYLTPYHSRILVEDTERVRDAA